MLCTGPWVPPPTLPLARCGPRPQEAPSLPGRSFPEQAPYLPGKGGSAAASCGPHLAARGRGCPPRSPPLPRDAQSERLCWPGLSRAGSGHWGVPEQHRLKTPTRAITQGRDSPWAVACVLVSCPRAPLSNQGTGDSSWHTWGDGGRSAKNSKQPCQKPVVRTSGARKKIGPLDTGNQL